MTSTRDTKIQLKVAISHEYVMKHGKHKNIRGQNSDYNWYFPSINYN